MALVAGGHVSTGNEEAVGRALLLCVLCCSRHVGIVTPLAAGTRAGMYMSDKPLIQQECAQRLAELIHSCPKGKELLFFRAFLECMERKWIRIDQHR